MKQKKLFLWLAIPLLMLNGCNNQESRPKPDVSKIELEVKVKRFDRDLASLSTQNSDEKVRELIDVYGDFVRGYADIFIDQEQSDTAQTVNTQQLLDFISDSYVRRIQDSINSTFVDTKGEEEQLTTAFKYFKYYFPKFTAPEILTVNSVYSAGVSPYGNDRFILGLDMFLGPNNKDYDSVGVYSYLRHKMQRQYIARYTVDALYSYYFEPEGLQPDRNLIEAIVDRGKKMYFLSMVFPDAPDSLILGYTQPQTSWCQQSELAVWQFLNDKDLLYKQNLMEQTRYLGEGPTTSGMPADAPGSIGNYIGLQIVRKFMKQVGDKVTLQDLILQYDAKTIFAKSVYRPAKK